MQRANPVCLLLVGLIFSAWPAAGRESIKLIARADLLPLTAALAGALAERVPDDPELPTPYVGSASDEGGRNWICSLLFTGMADAVLSSEPGDADSLAPCRHWGLVLSSETVGQDFVVLAGSFLGRFTDLTRAELFRALAATDRQPVTWSEVDPRLPAVPISVVAAAGRPDLRRAFLDLVLRPGCLEAGFPRHRCARVSLRIDGAWKEAPGDQRLVGFLLRADPSQIGIFRFPARGADGYGLRAIRLNGIAPDPGSLAEGAYPAEQSLVLYFRDEGPVSARSLKALSENLRASVAEWSVAYPTNSD